MNSENKDKRKKKQKKPKSMAYRNAVSDICLRHHLPLDLSYFSYAFVAVTKNGI